MNKATEGKSEGRKTAKNSSIRISSNTQKKIDRILSAANKKKFGRKIRADQLLNLALELVTASHIKTLQDQSMRNADRIEFLRQQYIASRGPISRDQFTGFMMTAEVYNFLKEQNSVTESETSGKEVAALAG